MCSLFNDTYTAVEQSFVEIDAAYFGKVIENPMNSWRDAHIPTGMVSIENLDAVHGLLRHVENILYWEANKTTPSLRITRDKVLPLLRHLTKAHAMMLITERNREELAVIISLLEAALKFGCRPKVRSISSSENLDTFQNGRREAVEHTIVTNKSQLPSLNDIVGQTEAKRALVEAVMDPVLFPEWFATSGINPWRCVLLYGPPGTGKTRLSQSIAREMNTRFYQVSSSDLISTWSGQSEKLIRELFNHALTYNGTSVIFIDEVDSLCRTRQITEDDNNRRVKTELFLQLERLHSSSKPVLLICATNCPWELDPAFLRRFERRIFVGLPDPVSRGILLKKFLNNITISDNINWNLLERITEGFSGDDLRRFAREVAFLQFNKFKDLCNLNCNANRAILAAQIPITAEDFEETLRNFSPTLNGFTLSRYAEYSKLV